MKTDKWFNAVFFENYFSVHVCVPAIAIFHDGQQKCFLSSWLHMDCGIACRCHFLKRSWKHQKVWLSRQLKRCLMCGFKDKLTLSSNVYKRANKTQTIHKMSHKVYIFGKQTNWRIYFCYCYLCHLICVYTAIGHAEKTVFFNFQRTVDSTFSF